MWQVATASAHIELLGGLGLGEDEILPLQIILNIMLVTLSSLVGWDLVMMRYAVDCAGTGKS